VRGRICGNDMNDQAINIILLAEAMGGPIWEAYINPSQHPECVSLPDPYTDANDCHDLIKHLNGLDMEVDTSQTKIQDSVTLRWFDDEGRRVFDLWKGDNYMQGVCELALKVLNNG